MKEKFEDRRLHGEIKVTCKYENAPSRVWVTTKQEVVQHIVSVVEEYRRLGYRLTLRQLHYQLVTKNRIVNHDTAYKKLGTILDDCRYAGIVDWDAIEDRGRVPYIPYSVDSPEEAIQDAHDYYRLNRQENQEVCVELWTEKDALSGILKRSTEKYHVQLIVNKGYTSSSAIYGAYKRIIENVIDGRTNRILYFGDHDPSGLDMVRDIKERLYFMMEHGRYAYFFESQDYTVEEMLESALRIVPIGLTMNQIRQYSLPPNPTKITDTRAAGYIEKYGKTCWEVDALDPTTLTALVEQHIEEWIDYDKYEMMLAKEKEDKLKLQKIIKKGV